MATTTVRDQRPATAPETVQIPAPAPLAPIERNETPDGKALYDVARHVPRRWGTEMRQYHTRVVTLQSYVDDQTGQLGYIQTATLSGARFGDEPGSFGAFRNDICLQLLSANGQSQRMTLSWAAAKSLVAAIETWSAEHPDPITDGTAPTTEDSNSDEPLADIPF